MKKRQVLSLMVSEGTQNQFVSEVFRLSQTHDSSYVCFANVHMLVECHSQRNFRQIVNDADVVAADGKPISVLLKWMHGISQEKISGPDFFLVLLGECQLSGASVFFYGSTPEVLKSLQHNLLQRFPLLNIKGMHAPPFRELSTEEKQADIDMINSLDPDFVFVGLGCPKQEQWMASNKGRILACMLGVGQVFDIYAGKISRSPLWMQRAGLEWLYRVCNEPKRLWRRYLHTNSLFLLLVIKNIVQSRLRLR